MPKRKNETGGFKSKLMRKVGTLEVWSILIRDCKLYTITKINKRIIEKIWNAFLPKAVEGEL